MVAQPEPTNAEPRALARVAPAPPAVADDGIDILTLGRVLAKSGYFADARDEAQAVVKVLYGRELGIPPIQAMTGIHIINGKPSPSAHLIATVIKRSGRYTFVVVDLSSTVADLEFYEGQRSIGRSSFSLEDAKVAGLTTGKNAHNWKQYPRNMLFARALTNGARWYCPDIFGGPVYVAEELGVLVDGATGEVIEPLERPLPARPSPAARPRREEMTHPADNAEITPGEEEWPHPEALLEPGETYQGHALYWTGGVLGYELRRPGGGRFLVSTEACPLHGTKDKPQHFYLGPDQPVDAWAHGKGEAKCRYLDVLKPAERTDAGMEDEVAAIDVELPDEVLE